MIGRSKPRIKMIKSNETTMVINNVKRTVWSPIRSVIIRVIDKSLIDLLITSMITDRIGQHEVLLLINQNYDKI